MTRVWAHRGASAEAPENTLEAFRLAADQGADGIELDVQLSADGELVVIHDETLDRTTDGTGLVIQTPLRELRKLVAANGFKRSQARIPTLREVFEEILPRGLVLNVELKNSVVPYPGLEEAVLGLVDELGVADKVVLSSFNHDSIAELRRLGSTSKLGVLLPGSMASPWYYAKGVGADAIHPRWNVAKRPGFVAACHAGGLEVNVWTVNRKKRLRKAARLGFDAVITNHPRRALKALGRDR